eukprot:6362253-Alexandrium_andersonii.AAC.1
MHMHAMWTHASDPHARKAQHNTYQRQLAETVGPLTTHHTSLHAHRTRASTGTGRDSDATADRGQRA